MHPGRDCVACHSRPANVDSAPKFVIAGTVFSKLREPDDCLGTGGATVTITDANKQQYALSTNNAGSFWLRASDAPTFKVPYTVKILHNGRQGQMYSSQTNGSCLSCHTAAGTAPAGESKAPGRICVDPNDPLCM